MSTLFWDSRLSLAFHMEYRQRWLYLSSQARRAVSQASDNIDDVIIEDEDEAGFLQALDDEFTLSEDAGLHLSRKKCEFLLISSYQ